MTTTKIVNKREGAIRLPPIGDHKTPRRWPARTLEPGLNVIDAEYWAECAKRSDIQHMLEQGLLGPPDASHAPKAVTSLEGMSESAAAQVISAATSADQLMEWIAREQRRPVLDALAARLAVVEAKAKREAVPIEGSGKKA